MPSGARVLERTSAILLHRSSLACVFACGAASFDRPITRVACDCDTVGCIRNEDSLARLPASFSLQSARLYPLIQSVSSLVARLYFACGAASVNRLITRVACDFGIARCIRNEDSLAYQPSSAFSLLACIHRYILFHRSTLACISFLVQHLSIGPSLAWLATAVS